MALTIKNLGEGHFGTTTAAMLYTVTTGKAAIVKSIRVVNRDTVSRTFNLYYKFTTGSGSRLVSPSALSLAPGAAYLDDTEISLGASDQIQGDGSVASKLDYVISGIERDARYK